MKNATILCSFAVLLGASTLLGLLGKPTEMGLAVVAGALGLAFANIDKIAKFKGAGFEAEMREKIETVVEKEIEPDVEIHAAKVEGYALVGDAPPKVVTALFDPRYTWRYTSGISKDTGVPREKVQEALDWLEKNKLARSTQGPSGTIWALSGKGREIFANRRPQRDDV